MGINKFADIAPEEFAKMQGLRTEEQDQKFLNGDDDEDEYEAQSANDEQDNANSTTGGRNLQSYPTSLDWR